MCTHGSYTKRGGKPCLRGFGVSEKIFKNKLFQSKIETRYKKGKSAFTHTIYLGSCGILGRIGESIENSCKSRKINIFSQGKRI